MPRLGLHPGRFGPEWMAWAETLTAVAIVAIAAGCVDPGSRNLDDESHFIVVTPGKTTVWAAPDDSTLAGLELTFGPRAVEAEAKLEAYPIAAVTSPIEALTVSGSSQRYRLIAPAFGLRPQGILFFEGDAHVRVAAPLSRAERKAWRLISGPSIEAIGKGLWRFESTVSAETSLDVYIGVLPQTQEYWPSEITDVSTPRNTSQDPNIVAYAACVPPKERVQYFRLEEPEASNECAADSDCVRTGCAMEVCTTGSVSSACVPADPQCGGCLCFGGTCRWVE